MSCVEHNRKKEALTIVDTRRLAPQTPQTASVSNASDSESNSQTQAVGVAEVAGGHDGALVAGIAVAAMMQFFVLKRPRTLVKAGLT